MKHFSCLGCCFYCFFFVYYLFELEAQTMNNRLIIEFYGPFNKWIVIRCAISNRVYLIGTFRLRRLLCISFAELQIILFLNKTICTLRHTFRRSIFPESKTFSNQNRFLLNFSQVSYHSLFLLPRSSQLSSS